jgi:hypothetical protein
VQPCLEHPLAAVLLVDLLAVAVEVVLREQIEPSRVRMSPSLTRRVNVSPSSAARAM